MVSARTSASGDAALDGPARDIQDVRRIDLALERAAEGDAECDRRAQAVLTCTGDDARRRGERLFDARPLVALVERLRHAECEPHLVEPGRDEPLVAALVEGEAGANHSGRLTRCGDHLFGVRHLWHAARIHEARHLDRRDPRRGQAPHELGARLDVEDVGLVLQAVARSDVVQGHSPRAHGRGHLTRPGAR